MPEGVAENISDIPPRYPHFTKIANYEKYCRRYSFKQINKQIMEIAINNKVKINNRGIYLSIGLNFILKCKITIEMMI
jgi:hypothetical protein